MGMNRVEGLRLNLDNWLRFPLRVNQVKYKATRTLLHIEYILKAFETTNTNEVYKDKHYLTQQFHIALEDHHVVMLCMYYVSDK